MSDTNIDFDSLLDLESQFYNESFHGALKQGEHHTNRDGKQFGIQTGYQRFILIGALNKINKTLIQICESKKSSESTTTTQKKPLNYEKLEKSLTEIQKNIDSFYSNDKLIKVSNVPEDVQFYEKNIKLIRSKIKSVYAQMGYKSLYPEIENACRSVAGDIPSTQINGDQQDIW